MSVAKSLRMPDELAERITALAEEQDRSFAWMCVRLMELGLGGPVRSIKGTPHARPAEPRENPMPVEPPAGFAVPERVPRVSGVVRASSLVKQGVKPIPKGGK